jgi:hypothetical protein
VGLEAQPVGNTDVDTIQVFFKANNCNLLFTTPSLALTAILVDPLG